MDEAASMRQEVRAKACAAGCEVVARYLEFASSDGGAHAVCAERNLPLAGEEGAISRAGVSCAMLQYDRCAPYPASFRYAGRRPEFPPPATSGKVQIEY